MNTDIEKPKTENSAGIISLRFADINNVESCENGIIKMKTGFQLRKIETKRGKWSFEGDFTTEGNGFYDFKLSGIISGHNKNILPITLLASITKLLLIVELDNVVYAAGNLDEGIHFKFGHFSGTTPGDETGYKFEFYRKLRKPVMVLDQVI